LGPGTAAGVGLSIRALAYPRGSKVKVKNQQYIGFGFWIQ